MAVSRENGAAPFPQQAPQDEGEQTESSFGTLEDCVPGNSSPQAKISSDLVKDKEPRTESIN